MKIFKISSVDMKITKTKILTEETRYDRSPQREGESDYEYANRINIPTFIDPLNLASKHEERYGSGDMADSIEGNYYVPMNSQGISELVNLINRSKRTILYMEEETGLGIYPISTKYIVGAKKGPVKFDGNTVMALKLYAKSYEDHQFRKNIKAQRNKSAIYLVAQYVEGWYSYANVRELSGGKIDIIFCYKGKEPSDEYIELNGVH